ncbi:hypothetical protein T492DRAFT_999303 [Pavlovales sp. CCMP2436]|nr:hypothetical protein T492DRAFT_999303 [Pavlovales sp. CCMP2436]
MSRSFVDTTLFGGHNTIAKARLARTREAALQQTAGVVAFGDMERIKMSATLPGQGPASAREQRADSLRAMSQARIAQWPNTLEAQRKKKEAVFAERLAAEEALKMAIDKEEETYKAEQRRLAIERANKMLYDQTDRVKALHTRMHMSEIQAVLDEQVAFKERVKERNRSREAMWVAQQKDMLRKMDAEEDARDEEEHARRMEERRLREEQVALKHAEYASKLQTIKREGELMRQKAADDLAAERDMSAARLAAEKAAREEPPPLNDFLKDLKNPPPPPPPPQDEKMHRTKPIELLLNKKERLFD